MLTDCYPSYRLCINFVSLIFLLLAGTATYIVIFIISVFNRSYIICYFFVYL